MKKAIIIGSGSAANHHAKALKTLGYEISFVTSRFIPNEITNKSIEEALKVSNTSLVVIANETYRHLQAVNELNALNYTGTVVCEKPLFALGKNLNVSEFQKFRISYNLRFDKSVLKFKNIIESHLADTKLVIMYYGRNLEMWRPQRNHLETYSAYTLKGGGVLWDLSHDLDLCFWLFGDLKFLSSFGAKVSNITVDADDFWDIKFSIIRNQAVGQLGLNYLDNKPERTLKVMKNNETLTLDILNGEIYSNSELIWQKGESGNTFVDMHSDIMNNEKDSACNLDEAMKLESFILSALAQNSFFQETSRA